MGCGGGIRPQIAQIAGDSCGFAFFFTSFPLKIFSCHSWNFALQIRIDRDIPATVRAASNTPTEQPGMLSKLGRELLPE